MVGLRRFATFAEHIGHPPTSPVTALPPTIFESFYLLHLKARAKQTAAVYANACRSFARYLARRRWTPGGATYDEIRFGLAELTPRTSYKRREVPEGLARIVLAAEAAPLPTLMSPSARWPSHAAWATRGLQTRRRELLRDRCLLRLLWCTGGRRAEICALNRGAVEEGHAWVEGKGGADRLLMLDDAAIEAATAYLEARNDSYKPLLLAHHRGRPEDPGPEGESWRLSPLAAYLIVRKWAAKAGIAGASPHHFRHRLAMQALNAGAQIGEVQNLLGHQSPSITALVYARHTQPALRRIFDQYGSRPEDEQPPG
jgi:integrase